MTIKEAIENIRTYSTIRKNDDDGQEICELQEEIDTLSEFSRRPTADEICQALEKDTGDPCKVMPNGEIWNYCGRDEIEEGKAIPSWNWVPLVESYGNGTYSFSAYLTPETINLISRFYKQDK